MKQVEDSRREDLGCICISTDSFVHGITTYFSISNFMYLFFHQILDYISYARLWIQRLICHIPSPQETYN